ASTFLSTGIRRFLQRGNDRHRRRARVVIGRRNQPTGSNAPNGIEKRDKPHTQQDNDFFYHTRTARAEHRRVVRLAIRDILKAGGAARTNSLGFYWTRDLSGATGFSLILVSFRFFLIFLPCPVLFCRQTCRAG